MTSRTPSYASSPAPAAAAQVRHMYRGRMLVYATALVGSPLLLMVYWLLYPAYGDLHAADVVADIGTAPDRTRLAEVFAFTAVFLALPMTLAYIRVLAARAPWLSRIGGALSFLGWSAVLPLLTVEDVVALELVGEPERFGALDGSTTVVVISIVAALHVLGGVLIGLALVRTRLIPRPLAVAAALAPIVHFTSNLAGLLWVDVASWLVAAATGVAVLPALARLIAAEELVQGGEQGGRAGVPTSTST